jgi:hypothetical protein
MFLLCVPNDEKMCSVKLRPDGISIQECNLHFTETLHIGYNCPLILKAEAQGLPSGGHQPGKKAKQECFRI